MPTVFHQLDAPRLTLRRLRLSDAPAMFARYAQDPEVTRYIAWPPHRTLDDTRDFLTRIGRAAERGRGFAYAILPRGETKLCGTLGFDRHGGTLTCGYVLARSHWGRGVASAAFGALVGWALVQPDLWRVEAYVHPDNQGSARVLEKCGLQREGLIRRHAVFPNLSDEPQDAWLYARVR